MFSEKHNKYTCEGCIENPDCATCKQHCFDPSGEQHETDEYERRQNNYI
jgi:hypothetical protein